MAKSLKGVAMFAMRAWLLQSQSLLIRVPIP